MSQRASRSAQVVVVPVVPVLVWCVLAGASTALVLSAPGLHGSVAEYGGDAGPLRLFADLLLFTCLFILPIWRRGRAEPTSPALVVVVFTGIVGVLTLARMAGIPIEELVSLIGFLTLISLCSDLCASALSRHRGVYYAAAGMLSFGAPLLRFFCQELFGLRVHWVEMLSPFFAWRRALRPEGGALWPAWVVFGVLAAVGGLCAVTSSRRTAG